MNRLIFAVILLMLSTGCAFGDQSATNASKPGLLVRNGTQLVMNGKPFRAVSVNKFDLPLQFLRGGAEREDALKAMQEIRKYGFRVVRVAVIGYYPNDMLLWPDPKYWERMDEFFAAARENQLLIIPVLVWNGYLFPDMSHETMQDMLTSPDSRSRQYLDLYIHQVVSRYKDEPSLLFWEIWSEMNLPADLEFMRPHGFSDANAVSYGAAFMRVRRDNYTTEQMIPFLRELATFIKKIDPDHLISSGHSSPRPAAQHLRLAKGKGDWTEDSPSELETYIRDSHPDPIDIISIHYYPGNGITPRFGCTDPDSAEPLTKIKRICDKIGKPVYIGEFGAQAFDDPQGDVLSFSRNAINEIKASDIPIALYWMCAKNPLRLDLDKAPELTRLLVEANRKVNGE